MLMPRYATGGVRLVARARWVRSCAWAITTHRASASAVVAFQETVPANTSGNNTASTTLPMSAGTSTRRNCAKGMRFQRANGPADNATRSTLINGRNNALK